MAPPAVQANQLQFALRKVIRQFSESVMRPCATQCLRTSIPQASSPNNNSCIISLLFVRADRVRLSQITYWQVFYPTLFFSNPYLFVHRFSRNSSSLSVTSLNVVIFGLCHRPRYMHQNLCNLYCFFLRNLFTQSHGFVYLITCFCFLRLGISYD